MGCVVIIRWMSTLILLYALTLLIITLMYNALLSSPGGESLVCKSSSFWSLSLWTYSDNLLS